MTRRRVLNVASLPATALGSRAPVWWGNTLLMVIETTTVALLLVSYFYLWRNFETWPPPQVNVPAPRLPALPDLWISTFNTVLLLGTCVLMYVVEQAAYKSQQVVVIGGSFALAALGSISAGLRFLEFRFLECRWDDNAYGSIVWALMVVHFTYIIVGVLEFVLLGIWIWMTGLDEKHVVDTALTASYWYWMVGVWIVLYGVIYWMPRIA